MAMNSPTSSSPRHEKQKQLHVRQADGTEATSYDEPSKKAKMNTSVSSTPKDTPEPITTPPSAHPPPNNDSDEPDEVIAGGKYLHCKSMQHRPTKGCAADEKAFQKSGALAFTFLIISNQEYADGTGKLSQVTLSCAFCPRNLTSWKWELKFGKSTGNFITHFKRSHSALWTDALKAERIAGGSQVVDDEETAGQQCLDVMVQVSIRSLRDL
jgi:hypothetical protein